VYFNGLGSTRQQGLGIAEEIVTHDGDGNVLYRAVTQEKDKQPLVYNILPAAEFDDVEILHAGNGVVHAEHRSRRWYHFWVDWPQLRDDTVVFLPHMTKPFKMGGPGQIGKACGDIRRALEWKRQEEGRRVVVYGGSRGAGIALLAVANLTSEEQDEVDLVIAEAPYDRVPNVVTDRTGRPFLGWLLEWFPWHAGPLDVTFPTNVPVIIGSGTEDTVCHLAGQKRIVEKMEREGHTDVTHVVAEGADHCNIIHDSEWKRVVHHKHLKMLGGR
jgi:alpha-beta hydrolase superfamily lysophospholipase